MLRKMCFSLMLCLPGIAIAQKGTIPAGTHITVRTIDAISSKTAAVGQDYRCSVDTAVALDSSHAIAKGADGVLRITDTRSAGTFTGSNDFELHLVKVRVGDSLVDVSSTPEIRGGAGKGKGTAVKTGVGAGAGAILGGVFGHGKGAAIGAGAGAAAGAATSALTHGPEVKVAPESEIVFVVQ